MYPEMYTQAPLTRRAPICVPSLSRSDLGRTPFCPIFISFSRTAVQSSFTYLISGKRDSKYQLPTLRILLPLVGVVVVLCSRSTTEVQRVVCRSFRQPFATMGHRYKSALWAPSTILSWIHTAHRRNPGPRPNADHQYPRRRREAEQPPVYSDAVVARSRGRAPRARSYRDPYARS